MSFSHKLLKNSFFNEQMCAFDPLQPQRIGEMYTGEVVRTGAITQPNGDTLVRVYAPNASTVHMAIGQQQRKCTLVRQSNGVFESIIPYDEELAGIQMLDLFLDDAVFLSPYMPVSFASFRPQNYIEIPEPDSEYLMINDVPHGSVGREIYWSQARGRYERCLVYTPPGYMNNAAEYPVLYVVHGSSENETAYFYVLKVQHIMDNLIAQGKCEPFLIVANDAMIRYDGELTEDNATLDDCFERTLCENCIPFIEKTYRAKATKWDRGIVGLSRGGYVSNIIGLKHPELFGSLGHLTCSMFHEHHYERPYLEALAHQDKFAENYKLFFRSTTTADLRIGDFYTEDALLAEAGIDTLGCYHRFLYPREKNFKISWRRGFMDMAKLLFR